MRRGSAGVGSRAQNPKRWGRFTKVEGSLQPRVVTGGAGLWSPSKMKPHRSKGVSSVGFTHGQPLSGGSLGSGGPNKSGRENCRHLRISIRPLSHLPSHSLSLLSL